MILLITVVALLSQFPANGYPSSSSEEEGDTEAPRKFPVPYEGSGFEGDMLYPDVAMSRGIAKSGNTVRWPNGIMPYEFATGFAFSEETSIIETMAKMQSLVSISNNICIHFRPKLPSDIYYIIFKNGVGCTSYVGQNTGLNITRTVSLQHPGCIYEGTIMHELLHAFGFNHEQSRPDRDNYVRINFTNIQPGKEFNFDKLSNTSVDTLNISYDYASVMHYGATAFTVNGFPTIEVLQPNTTIGADNMSSTDIQEVRVFYNCSASVTPLPNVPNATLPNIYMVNTTISSSLTSSDRLYKRYLTSSVSYYYHIYSIIVPVKGYYSIMSDSAVDLYGYIYYPNFTATDASINVIAYNDDSAGNQQFQIIMNLPANTEYFLVVTSKSRNRTGPYTVTVSALNNLNFNRVYELDPPANTTTSSSSTTTTDNSRQTVIIIVSVVMGSVLITVIIVLAFQKVFCCKRKL